MEKKNMKGRQAPAGRSGGKTSGKTGAGTTGGKAARGKASGKSGKVSAKKGGGRKNKKEGKKGGSLLTTLIMLIAFGILAVSVYQIVMMVLPYYTGGQEYDKVKEMAVTEPDSGEEGEEKKPGDGFQVDFEALLAENPDTVAWIRMEEPAIIKQGNKYGVKIHSEAPSIHLIRANIETEIAPIVGNEQQAQDLIRYIKDAKESEEGIWGTNIFGKSIEELVMDGMQNKMAMINDESQEKLQNTMQKIVNDSNGGLVCIII
mgnify:CR=1 FL=1